MGEGLTRDEVTDLYRRYGMFLRRRCSLLLRDATLADDATQETFIKVLRAGAALRTASEPLRYLYRVADRACFDQLRRGKRMRQAKDIDDVASELPCHPGIDPEARRAALDVLAALDDAHKQIAVMAFVDGMTQQEIADEIGTSRMTVVKRVAHIRERAERATRERPAAVVS